MAAIEFVSPSPVSNALAGGAQGFTFARLYTEIPLPPWLSVGHSKTHVGAGFAALKKQYGIDPVSGQLVIFDLSPNHLAGNSKLGREMVDHGLVWLLAFKTSTNRIGRHQQLISERSRLGLAVGCNGTADAGTQVGASDVVSQIEDEQLTPV